MIKYKYELNTETNLVERSISETYPDKSILDRGLSLKRNPDLIQKQYLNALRGVAESLLISVEEEWYEQQKLVESLTLEAKTIKDQLTGAEEVLDDVTQEVLVEAVEKVTDEDIVKSLEDRLAQIEDKIVYFFDDAGIKQNTTTLGELNTAIAARALLEDGDADNEAHEWLKTYRGEATEAVRPVPAEPVIPREDAKKLIAHDRDLTVRNNEDSIADLAKMVSLSFSAISAIWAVTSDDAKSLLPTETKDIVDYAVLKFGEIDTRADDQLADEGVALIDKLFEREVAIATIVKKY